MMNQIKLTKRQIKVHNKLVSFIKKTQTDRMFLIEGGAGSGKTTTLSYILSKLIKKRFLDNSNIFLLAPTNAAKKVMSESIIKIIESDKESRKEYTNAPNNVIFKTIHSFFKSTQQYTESGQQLFDLSWSKNQIGDTVKDQRKMRENDPTFHIRENHLVIIDECSMLDEKLFQMFSNLIEECGNIKIVFMGDRNQLSYVRTKEDQEDENGYLSPVFTKVANVCILKGNERSNNEGLTAIINRAKKSVVKNEFLFKLYKKDESKCVNLINDMDLITKESVKKFVIEQSPKIITYSNKRRDDLNKIVRNLKYTRKHPHIDNYVFLENENIIFEQNFSIGDEVAYLNTDEFVVKEIEYNKVETITIFDLFRKTFTFQKITLDDGFSMNQLSIKDMGEYKTILKVLRAIVGMYFKYNMDNAVFMKGEHECVLCNTKKNNTIDAVDNLPLCFDCHTKVRRHINAVCFCQLCGKLRGHTDCKRAKTKSIHKTKKSVYTLMYSKIQDMENAYILPVKYSYSITCYKSQGNTYDNVIIDYSNIYNCNRNNIDNLTRSMYVAISRVRNNLWFLNYFKHK